MFWTEKCCYCIPLNLGCAILGVVNVIISLSLTIASVVYYFTPRGMVATLTEAGAGTSSLGLSTKTLTIIESVVVIVSLFWVVFSILLAVGIIRNEPSLMLSYFFFGIILTILWLLNALLMLINDYWWISIAFFIASMINIHFLIVVYTVYEQMQRGQYFGFRRYSQDEEPLADPSTRA